MASASEGPAELLAHSAKLEVFLMLRRTLQADRIAEHLADHLRWMIAREREGRIFLSGPVAPGEAAASQLDGLTVIRADDLEAAIALANEDPFVKAGIVAFDMRKWTINEGALPLTFFLSDSRMVVR